MGCMRYKMNRPPMWFFLAIIVVVLLYLLTGCKSTQYVEVPVVKKEVEYRDRIERDTAYVRDSIYIHAKNDTIFVDKYKYVYREHIKTDTTYVYKTDTITKVITREKDLSKWQKLQMGLGGTMIGIIILLLIACVVYVVLRLRHVI